MPLLHSVTDTIMQILSRHESCVHLTKTSQVVVGDGIIVTAYLLVLVQQSSQLNWLSL